MLHVGRRSPPGQVRSIPHAPVVILPGNHDCLEPNSVYHRGAFGTLPNVLASLVVPYQIPAILVISERGTMGEFNVGQALVARTMRPALDSIGIAHHTLDDDKTMPFVLDRSIKQAVATQSPVAFILSPLLTGGKTFKPS